MRTYTITHNASMWHVHTLDEQQPETTILLQSFSSNILARQFAFSQASREAPAEVVEASRMHGRVTIAIFEKKAMENSL